MTDAGTVTESSVAGKGHRRQPDRPPKKTGEKGAGFRADVEGLRAVAVLLVLIYHAGVAFLPGGFIGVDVFFVISGFLITGLLLTELGRSDTISLPRFYARRAKRLLPAAAVVLVATTVMTWAFMPRHRWDETGGDIVGSALYFVNWRFADRSVDYLAEGVPPSPVQHFWSLAVEEQFYFVWPLLMIVAALIGRKFGHPRFALAAALAAVAIPSYAYSIHATAVTPQSAFFVSTTRIWELALGAFVAVGAVKLAKLPRGAAIVLGWAGVATIVTAGLLLDEKVAWPGSAAAIPVLGAVAVLVAGFTAGPRGPVAILGTQPFRWVGGLSYSLYLWHWPLLVIAREYFDGLTVGESLLVVGLSFVPAWLTQRLIENPVRFSKAMTRSPRLALSLGGNCTLAGAAAGLALVIGVGATTPALPIVAKQELGAATLTSASGRAAAAVPVDFVEGITPDPASADKDVPDIYALGCQQDKVSADPVRCFFGPQPAPGADPITIAVVGDSKAGQWLPALQLLANENHWRVITYTKSGCAFVDAVTVLDGKPYKSCQEWGRHVMGLLTGADRPDFVLTSQNAARVMNDKGKPTLEAMTSRLSATWKTLTNAGVQVLVLADNPHPDQEVWQCASENSQKLSKCAFDRSYGVETSAAKTQYAAVKAAGGKAVAPGTRAARDAVRPGTAPVAPLYLDLLDSICPAAKCVPVIGHVLVYRQGAHLTATYVSTLAPRLEQLLRAAGVPSGKVAQAGIQAAPPLPGADDKSVQVEAVKAPAKPAKDAKSDADVVAAGAKAAEKTADAKPAAKSSAKSDAKAAESKKADEKAAQKKAEQKADEKAAATKADEKKAAAKAAEKEADKPAEPADGDEPTPATDEPAAEEPPTQEPAKPSPLGGLLPPPNPDTFARWR